jgi:PTH1 family peptidyl-tRNA hydrolase
MFRFLWSRRPVDLGPVEKLVIGVGNIGKRYVGTRHNLGFRAIDTFLEARGVKSDFKRHKNADVQPVTVHGVQRLLLVKPRTFVNLTGDAVATLLRAFDLSIGDILLLHDELDMQPGFAKMCLGGGAGGHKGVSDVIAKSGEAFCRVKIGVGKPGLSTSTANWVLSVPTGDDEVRIADVLPIVAEAIGIWARNGADPAMKWMNTRTRRAVAKSMRPADQSDICG